MTDILINSWTKGVLESVGAGWAMPDEPEIEEQPLSDSLTNGGSS